MPAKKFFAGIGVWQYALQQAGYPAERPVWTGSCPCQPFSSAGKQAGFDDPRHLWPTWFNLIRQRRPPTVFGEQVANGDGLTWLQLVQDDMERESYAIAPFDLCAAGFGAPHIRQRLYFVTESLQAGDAAGGLVNPVSAGLERQRRHDHVAQGRQEPAGPVGAAGVPGPVNGYWADAEWIYCRDDKFRPTKPGIFPLAVGATARVGRLRAYGNAIVAPLAIEFIRAYLSLRP